MLLTRLREWRERRYLTQAELAERSGVAETSINRIEKGRAAPRFSTIRKLAAALGVDPDDLGAPRGARERARLAA